jgi:hypothetical protein
MFSGIAMPLDQLSSTQLIRHGPTHRVHDRLGVLEVYLLAKEKPRLLPVLIGSELRVFRWGNRRDESPNLPTTLWKQLSTVEAGG